MSLPTLAPRAFRGVTDHASKAYDDPMEKEVKHRLMDGDRIIEHRMLSRARAMRNNALLEGTPFHLELA